MPFTALTAHPKKQRSNAVTATVIPIKANAVFFLFPLKCPAAYRLTINAVNPVSIRQTVNIRIVVAVSTDGTLSILGILGRIGFIISAFIFTSRKRKCGGIDKYHPAADC